LKTVIWTNGVFDVLHPGHIDLLRFAKSLGDFLVVGLDSDDRVSEMKGPTRPINSWEDRKKMLEAVRHVDLVVGFGSNEQISSHLQFFRPSVIVDNPGWTPQKTPYLPEGIEVRKFELIEGYSSTNIINRIRESRRI
jgi:rfaE bifunctional protein nucleotidyltransferase chain/domain